MIVRFASVSLVALLSVSAFAVGGCASSTPSTASDSTAIGSSEAALSTDNDSTQESEDGAEQAEDGLSGASASDPGTPAQGTTTDDIDAKIKSNPGVFFQPAGCIVSTRVSAGVWNHVFTNCTGPAGKRTYNGTIQSRWTVSPGELQVIHTATNFVVEGPNNTATVSGARTVTYTNASNVITKKRVGTWTGTVEHNATSVSEAWTHNANFTSTWDPSTKCYTRDGEVDNTLGNRAFGRTVSGYKACGSIFACPESGQLVLDRKDDTVKITITFLGDGNYDIEGAKARKVERKLVLCVAG